MQSVVSQASCTSRCQHAARPAFVTRVQPCVAARPRTLVAEAISKQKKSDVVANLTDKLNSSALVYGLSYEGVRVKDVETMRRQLPEGVSMVVTKNRLLRVAIDNLGGEAAARWEGLKGLKGMNAFVFVPEDDIRSSVTAYNEFLKALKSRQAEPKKGQPAPPPPTSIKAIVLDGQTLDDSKWASLEKIPTKMELLTQIARGIKANPTKIALGIKALPLKLAYGVKALSELNDDKTMTVEAAAAAKRAEDN